MQTVLAQMEIELAAVVLESVACDVHEIARRGRMVATWEAGKRHAAAVEYVVSHFARYGDSPAELTTAESTDALGGVDVSFRLNGRFECMTVWLEDVGHGPFLYGEY